MKLFNVTSKNFGTASTILTLQLLLLGCSSQTENEKRADQNSSEGPAKTSGNSFLEQDTSGGILLNDGDFTLVSLKAANTRNEDGSGSIHQLALTWEAASAGNNINYSICEMDISEIDSCRNLGTIRNELTYTLTLDSLVDAAEHSYFILADSGSEVLTSSEKQIHPGELGAMAGFVKASNAGYTDHFGVDLALSGDGHVLAVGAKFEDSASAGINNDQTLDAESVGAYGAVYMFQADGAQWSQTDYIKASNPDMKDYFGFNIAMNENGTVLAVGAYGEDSASATDQTDNSLSLSGAVYIFTYDGSNWVQSAYLKDESPEENDYFGYSVSMSNDGNRLAVGAPYETSDVSGNTVPRSGAVMIFDYDTNTEQWRQTAHLEASNYDENDQFGLSIVLSGDGSTLAVGARQESSSATGINSVNSNDNSAKNSGAVYVFSYDSSNWNQTAYLKASNATAGDLFGASVDLNTDGSILAVGASEEDSAATGVNGDKLDNSAIGAGAVYLFSFDGSNWAEDYYLKASNTAGAGDGFVAEDAIDPNSAYWGDHFGEKIKLNDQGSILAVAAINEDSQSIGINWEEDNDDTPDSGAVYLFAFDDATNLWKQTHYIKSPSTHSDDSFGSSIDLSNNASVLAIGDMVESSGSTGINGTYTKFDDDENNDEGYSGAVYLY